MDWNDIIDKVFQLILVPLIIWGITEFRNYLKSKIEIEEIAGILEQATKAVEGAVGMVAQKFVKELKAQGEFTTEKGVLAFQIAKATALSTMSIEGIKLLERVTGDANKWIETQIENAVGNLAIDANQVVIVEELVLEDCAEDDEEI